MAQFEFWEYTVSRYNNSLLHFLLFNWSRQGEYQRPGSRWSLFNTWHPSVKCLSKSAYDVAILDER